MTKAEGEFITFLDCDDELAPDCFKDQRLAILDQSITLSYGAHFIVDADGKVITRADIDGGTYSENYFERLLQRYETNIVGTLVRKSAIAPMPPIADYQFAADYLMFMSAAGKGRVHCTSHIVGYFRVSAGSETERTSSRQCRELFSANRWLITHLDIKIPKAMAKAKARALYHQMKHEMSAGRPKRAIYIGRRIRPYGKAYFSLSLIAHWPWLWGIVHRRRTKAILTRFLGLSARSRYQKLLATLHIRPGMGNSKILPTRLL